jgi:hypothetical protein
VGAGVDQFDQPAWSIAVSSAGRRWLVAGVQNAIAAIKPNDYAGNAPEALAMCVAIASINTGDRVS